MERTVAETPNVPIASRDVLTEILRQGAQDMLAAAIQLKASRRPRPTTSPGTPTCPTSRAIASGSATAICRPGRSKRVWAT